MQNAMCMLRAVQMVKKDLRMLWCLTSGWTQSSAQVESEDEGRILSCLMLKVPHHAHRTLWYRQGGFMVLGVWGQLANNQLTTKLTKQSLQGLHTTKNTDFPELVQKFTKLTERTTNPGERGESDFLSSHIILFKMSSFQQQQKNMKHAKKMRFTHRNKNNL